MKKINNYKSYEEYVKHQSSKAPTKIGWLKTYHPNFVRVLYDRIKQHKGTVLCLGARTGAECEAFNKAGCFVVGIDLYPTKDSFNVMKGDFHKLNFPDNTFDIVFTNSFDHALNLTKMVKEIKRVLKITGTLVFECEYGAKEGGNFAEYEVIQWNYIKELIQRLERYGFRLIQSNNITYPCKGKHIEMRLLKWKE